MAIGGGHNTTSGSYGVGQPADASREARIAHRKSRIEANRLAKLKPDKTDGKVYAQPL
jgi:hypothetical protein